MRLHIFTVFGGLILMSGTVSPWVFQQIQLATPNEEGPQVKKSNIPSNDTTDSLKEHHVLTKSNIPLHDAADGVENVASNIETVKSDIPAKGSVANTNNTESPATAKSNISGDEITEDDLKTIMPLLSPHWPSVKNATARSSVTEANKGNSHAVLKSADQKPGKLDIPQETQSIVKETAHTQSSPAEVNSFRPPAIPVRTNIPMTSRLMTSVKPNVVTQPFQMRDQNYQVAGQPANQMSNQYHQVAGQPANQMSNQNRQLIGQPVNQMSNQNHQVLGKPVNQMSNQYHQVAGQPANQMSNQNRQLIGHPVNQMSNQNHRVLGKPVNQMSNPYHQVIGQRSMVLQTPRYYYPPRVFHNAGRQLQNVPRSVIPAPWYQHQYPRRNIQTRVQAYAPNHRVPMPWQKARQQQMMYRSRTPIPFYQSRVPKYAQRVKASRQPLSYYYRRNVFPGHLG